MPETLIPRLRLALWCLLGAMLLTGCNPKKPDRLGAPIEGYNHTSAAINWFMVNRNGGPNVGAHGGGGSQTCCVSLPRKWHPGLTVLVEWEKDVLPYDQGTWKEPRNSDAWHARAKHHKVRNYSRHSAVVEVAPYEKLGAVDVHFLPCNQIAVSAVAQLPGQPGYPFHYPRKMEEPATCPKP